MKLNLNSPWAVAALFPALAGALLFVRATSPTPSATVTNGASTAANFERFKNASRSGVEREFISDYALSTGAKNHVQGTVNLRWHRLNQSQQMQVLTAAWQRWASTNSPDEPRQSSLTLFSGSQTVGHAGYTVTGKWEIATQ